MTIELCIFLFIFQMAVPIIAIIYYGRKDTEVLYISSEYTKNPRYFAERFCLMFDEAWEKRSDDNRIQLSKIEKVLYMKEEMFEEEDIVEHVLYEPDRDFVPPPAIQFQKEIYACHNAIIEGTKGMRAIACKKQLVLGEGTKISRWADAVGALVVVGNADLGMSTSSLKAMYIGKNTWFRRLYASKICLGDWPQIERINEIAPLDLYDKKKEIIRNIRYVDQDVVNEDRCLEASIISKEDLRVIEGITLKGDIHSQKGIRLGQYVTVYGNVFAEEDIFIEKHCRVYGSVYTFKNIYCDGSFILGESGKTKSLIAREHIYLQENVVVYGYIEAGDRGVYCGEYVT